MGKDKKLVVFGSAEIARLAKYYFEHDSDYEVVAFTVDDEYVDAEELEGLPLVPFSKITDRYPPSEYEMFVGVSFQKLNQLREAKYLAAKEAGYTLASYVCSKSVFWNDLDHGDNCFILENQTIQPTVKIGNNVMIWSWNLLAHGAVIRDHVYIASHVCISGHCDIGERCFLGVSSTVRDFCKVGADSFITMGAPVTHDILPGSVVVSARGRVFAPGSSRGELLKRNYFRF